MVILQTNTTGHELLYTFTSTLEKNIASLPSQGARAWPPEGVVAPSTGIKPRPTVVVHRPPLLLAEARRMSRLRGMKARSACRTGDTGLQKTPGVNHSGNY